MMKTQIDQEIQTVQEKQQGDSLIKYFIIYEAFD